MKTRILFTLPLAASLMLPAMAQQAPADDQQPSARLVAEQLAIIVIFQLFEPECQLRSKYDGAAATRT